VSLSISGGEESRKEIPSFGQVGGKEDYFKNVMSFRGSPESKKRTPAENLISYCYTERSRSANGSKCD